jgi:hypothetical protein
VSADQLDTLAAFLLLVAVIAALYALVGLAAETLAALVNRSAAHRDARRRSRLGQRSRW